MFSNGCSGLEWGAGGERQEELSLSVQRGATVNYWGKKGHKR